MVNIGQSYLILYNNNYLSKSMIKQPLFLIFLSIVLAEIQNSDTQQNSLDTGLRGTNPHNKPNSSNLIQKGRILQQINQITAQSSLIQQEIPLSQNFMMNQPAILQTSNNNNIGSQSEVNSLTSINPLPTQINGIQSQMSNLYLQKQIPESNLNLDITNNIDSQIISSGLPLQGLISQKNTGSPGTQTNRTIKNGVVFQPNPPVLGYLTPYLSTLSSYEQNEKSIAKNIPISAPVINASPYGRVSAIEHLLTLIDTSNVPKPYPVLPAVYTASTGPVPNITLLPRLPPPEALKHPSSLKLIESLSSYIPVLEPLKSTEQSLLTRLNQNFTTQIGSTGSVNPGGSQKIPQSSDNQMKTSEQSPKFQTKKEQLNKYENCRELQDENCIECEGEAVLIEGQCFLIPEFCTSFDISLNSCIACENGYINNSGQCIK